MKLIKLVTLIFLFAQISAFAISPDVSGKQSQQSSQQLTVFDINHSSLTQWLSLKGVGEKKAHDIVEYLQAHGDFTSLDDLANIKGIGRAWLKRFQLQNPNVEFASKANPKNN